MAITVLPLIVYCEQILELWLTTPPPYAVTFTRLILFYSVIRTLHGPIDLLFKAVGKIRKYQIVDSCSLLLSLPASYGLLKMGCPVYGVFVAMSGVEVVNLLLIVYLANADIKFSIKNYLMNVIASTGVCLFMSFFIGQFFYRICVPVSLYQLFLYMLFIIISGIILFYICLLNKIERKYIRQFSIVLFRKIF